MEKRLKLQKNVSLFDYNSPQKKTPFRVGNHLTLISNSNGKVNISTLCDDMSINKTRCSTESLESKVVKLA